MTRSERLIVLVCCALLSLAIGYALGAKRAFAHGYRYMGGSASSYCTGTTTSSGRAPEWGTVAAAYSVPLGSWIQVTGPRSALARLGGRRYFKVTDRGQPGLFLIDIWTRTGRCGWSYSTWGRRNVTIRIVPRHHLWKGRPLEGYVFRGLRLP